MLAAVPPPPISPATQQLIGYGLLLGGAAVVGKLVIDALVVDMDAAKARREFIGPIYEAPPPPKDIHVHLSDVVKFVAMLASVYSVVAQLPDLVAQWGSIEAQAEQLVKVKIMSTYLSFARAWLTTIDPAAPAALLILVIFLTVYVVRRASPRTWLWVTGFVPAATQIDPSPVLSAIGKLLQALPAAIYGAAISALTQGLSVKSAVQGVVAGFLAAVVHEVMANYQGKVSEPPKLER